MNTTGIFIMLCITIVGCFCAMFLWTRFTRWRRRHDPRQPIVLRVPPLPDSADVWQVEKKPETPYKNGGHK